MNMKRLDKENQQSKTSVQKKYVYNFIYREIDTRKLQTYLKREFSKFFIGISDAHNHCVISTENVIDGLTPEVWTHFPNYLNVDISPFNSQLFTLTDRLDEFAFDISITRFCAFTVISRYPIIVNIFIQYPFGTALTQLVISKYLPCLL